MSHVTDERRFAPRTSTQKKAWAKFRTALVRARYRRHLYLDPDEQIQLDFRTWNAIRNAWYDGYWTAVEVNNVESPA